MEIPTTRNIVAQKPSLLTLSLRVQENHELSMSSAVRRPQSSSLCTESGMNAWSPMSVRRRFLLRLTNTGLLVLTNSSVETNLMNDSGVDHLRRIARRRIISPKSHITSRGASSM